MELTFLQKVGCVVEDLRGHGLSSWAKAFVTSISDRDVVVEKKETEDSIIYRVKQKVSCVVDGAFEKIANIAQHTCAAFRIGSKLTPLLEGATGFIDATRIFSFFDWILKGCKSESKIEFVQQIAFGLVGVLSTAYTLHAFKIIDLSFIASGIGSLASFGGFGFVGAIGVIPLIHGVIAVGIVCGIVMTASKIKELWTDKKWQEEDDAWKKKTYSELFFCYIGIAGNVAEVAFRGLSIATGTAPLVLPILGLVSNGIGYFKILKTTRDENDLTESSKVDLEKKKITVGNSKEDLTEVEKLASSPTLGHIFKSIVAGTSQLFSSVKGMEKLCKLGGAVLEKVAPLATGPILMMKAFRGIVDGTVVADLAVNPIKKGEMVRTAANLFLFAGNLFDTANFIAKNNIANLGRFAGNFGQFKIFGVVGRVSFSSLKLTCMAAFLALDLCASFAKMKDAYSKLKVLKNDKNEDIGKKHTDKYDHEYNELLIKLFMNVGKIGMITLSGGFILFAGYSAATVFTIFQVGVLASELVNWIRKSVVNKPADLVYVDNGKKYI